MSRAELGTAHLRARDCRAFWSVAFGLGQPQSGLVERQPERLLVDDQQELVLLDGRAPFAARCSLRKSPELARGCRPRGPAGPSWWTPGPVGTLDRDDDRDLRRRRLGRIGSPRCSPRPGRSSRRERRRDPKPCLAPRSRPAPDNLQVHPPCFPSRPAPPPRIVGSRQHWWDMNGQSRSAGSAPAPWIGPRTERGRAASIGPDPHLGVQPMNGRSTS